MSGRDLQKLPAFKKADHKMLATRKASTQQTIGGTGKRICNTWSNDDGEKYAGKHLERVLNELDVEGAVVVVRWYGGVLLGPVRFEHIKNVARDAIRKWKESQRTEIGAPTKRIKVEDEAVAKPRLVKQLKERDESIVVLRKLLADKTKPTDQPKDERDTQSTQHTTSPAKQINYDDMPLARLKQLDKARDATIAFILKQIDAIEASNNKEKDTEGDSRDTE